MLRAYELHLVSTPLQGGADEDELFQTRSKCWDRPEVLHGVAASGAY